MVGWHGEPGLLSPYGPYGPDGQGECDALRPMLWPESPIVNL